MRRMETPTRRRRIETAIGRLSEYFDAVNVGAPPSDVTRAKLRRATGGLPKGLEAYFDACDGVRVGTQDGVYGELFSAKEITKICSLRLLDDRWIPLRSDGCGNYDVVVRSFARGVGSVVFFDHEAEGVSHFLASSVPAYVEMWADWLLSTFKPDGSWKTRAKRHPWPFDLEWVQARDPAAGELLNDPDFAAIVSTS